MKLPPKLHRHWVLRLGRLEPAWPDEPRMQFDASYQPVVAGNTLFVASSRSGSVAAFDVETAVEKWRFYADGPVRFAPTAWNGRVYFTSDDGWVYCLDADSGKLRWRFRGGPSGRKVLGNQRLISMWPARGGPVVADGPTGRSGRPEVYFAAGIWPFMGVFLYALDAETGRVIWCNDACGSLYVKQPHNSSAFAGVAPQGYLVVAGDRLIVPNGRAVAAGFDRRTGKLLYFHHAANHHNGHSEAAAAGRYFINSGELFDLGSGSRVTTIAFAGVTARKTQLRAVRSARVLYNRLTDRPIVPIGPVGVLDGGVCYRSAGDAIVAVDVTKPVTGTYVDYRGKRKRGRHLRVLWKLPTPAKPMLKAGGRLYAAAANEIVAVDPPARGRPAEPVASASGNKDEDLPKARIAWREKIAETPAAMIAAAGRLFVVSHEGSILCYGRNPGGPPRAPLPKARRGDPPDTQPAAALAANVLRAAGVTEGYCLVLGIKDGRLAEQLVRRSKLRVIALDADAGRIDAFRRRIDRAGLAGKRLSAIVAEPLSAELPSYLASLIVSEEPAGFSAALHGEAGASEPAVERVRKLFRTLRPYGGALCLPIPDATRDALARQVEAGDLPGAELRRVEGFTLLIRKGALPGAGTWTGQYGNAANTCTSADRLVKAPLGLLWFGGPSNAGILPRHGHGPPEQVIGGRLFIEGPDVLRALDVYTGRLLWEADLPGIGKNYDYTTHEPGANALGTNYAATRDGVYVVSGRRCVRLDPATGRTVQQFDLPGIEDDPAPEWGYLGVADDLLVAGASPMMFWMPDLDEREFRRTFLDRSGKRVRFYTKGVVAKLVEAVGTWQDFEVDKATTVLLPPPDTEPDRRPTTRPATELDFIAANYNKMLGERRVLAKLPESVVAAARARREAEIAKLEKDGLPTEELDTVDAVQAKVERHLSADGTGGPDDRKLHMLNRRLLELCYPFLLPFRQPKLGQHTLDGTASGGLLVMNRYTGEALWRRRAAAAFRHNTIALGGGMLFCIDRTPRPVIRRMLRRGAKPKTTPSLLALDVRTGRVLWSKQEDVFGTWLGYSVEHDVLLQAGRASRDMLDDEPSRRLIAYRGRTGQVLWDKAVKYGGPCMLHGKTIITQGFALDLLTGRKKKRAHPLTGEPIDWKFKRNYGCNYAIASRHLLTFRSAAAGFFDLAGDGGTGNLGGFKSGCTSNLVVADGVLNAPDYTRTCTCSYQNQSSLGLVHMPEVEMWTFQDFGRGKKPIRRLGVNFGAPGDRRAENGTLWLEYPIVGGSSPSIKIAIEPSDPAGATTFRRHSSRLSGAGLRWVAASGIEGATEVTISLADRKAKTRPYTVSLHFAEPGQAKPGERVFSVGLQGATVLKDLDAAAEAGAPLKAVVKTFGAVGVKDKLTITLTPSRNAKIPRPILCGVEVAAEP